MLNKSLFDTWSVPLTADETGPRFYFSPPVQDDKVVFLMTASGVARLLEDPAGFFIGFRTVPEAIKTLQKRSLSFEEALYKLTRGPARPTFAMPVDSKGQYNPGREDVENLIGPNSIPVMHALGAALFPVSGDRNLMILRRMVEGRHFTKILEKTPENAMYAQFLNQVGHMKFSPLTAWRALAHGLKRAGTNEIPSVGAAAEMLMDYHAVLSRHIQSGRDRAKFFALYTGSAPVRPEQYLNPLATSIFVQAMQERIADYLGADFRFTGTVRHDRARLEARLAGKGAPHLPDWSLGDITTDAYRIAARPSAGSKPAIAATHG